MTSDLTLTGDQPLHRAPDTGPMKRKLSRCDEVADNFSGRPWPEHANAQVIPPGKGPLRRARQDEVTVGADLTVLDQWLHDGEE